MRKTSSRDTVVASLFGAGYFTYQGAGAELLVSAADAMAEVLQLRTRSCWLKQTAKVENLWFSRSMIWTAELAALFTGLPRQAALERKSIDMH